MILPELVACKVTAHIQGQQQRLSQSCQCTARLGSLNCHLEELNLHCKLDLAFAPYLANEAHVFPQGTCTYQELYCRVFSQSQPPMIRMRHCCADTGLVLAFKNLPGNVSVDNSQFTSLPGFVIVSNSSMRFTNATFSQGNTNGPGQYPECFLRKNVSAAYL